MFHPHWGKPVRLARHFSMLTLLMLALSAVEVRAQGGVGSSRGLPDSASGIHTIRGYVFLPTGRRAGRGILVRLSANVSGTRTSSTDSDGSFLFNSLPAGEYRMTIDGGPDYVPASQSVVIYGTTGGGAAVGRAGQTIMLDIQLVPKDAAADEQLFAGIPKDAVESYRKAMQLIKAGNSKKAVEQLNSAIAVHPKFAPALGELGTQYLKLGDPKRAAETLKVATELAPTNFTNHLNYGIALLNQKDLAGAEVELRQALKINNVSPAAHMYLGISLLGLSRDEQTKKFDADKYAEAQKELETATSSGKEEVAMAHRYLAGIYWGQRDHKRAANELETYLKLAPQAADAERTRAAIKDLRSKQ